MKSFYVYLLVNGKNNKSYVGFTSKDPIIRVKEHNTGSNSFTKNNGPWKLIYFETFSCKTCALIRERFLKTGVGKKLRNIIIDHFIPGIGAVG